MAQTALAVIRELGGHGRHARPDAICVQSAQSGIPIVQRHAC